MRGTPLLAATLAALAAAAPAAAQLDLAGEDTTASWSYAGPTGPEFWPRFSAECAGPRQSPVDLPGRPGVSQLRLLVQYPAWSDGRIGNNGHSVYLLPGGSTGSLRLGDTTFTLRQVHIHVPAEHTVQGHRYAAEIHAVNQYGNGNRAVLTTFVAEGGHNAQWEALIAALPGHDGQSNPIAGRVDLAALLSLQNVASEWMYSYAGSLTTPPCTPNVRFLIRQAPIMLSREQVHALSAAMVRNIRPVQRTSSPILLHRGAPE